MDADVYTANTDTFVRPPYRAIGQGDTAGIDVRLLPISGPATHRARRGIRVGAGRVATVLVLCLAAVLGSLAIGGGVAHASTIQASHSRYSARMAAFYDARSRAGDPYAWGAAGPSAFDCSGLVYWAYRKAGITLPRDTYEMLAAVASGLLQPTSHPVKGDLAFYGSGHVELFVRWGHTFGALQSGSPVWWHHYGGWWVPTLFFHVRGAR